MTETKKKIIELFSRQGLPPLEQLHRMITGRLQGSGEFGEIYVQQSTSRTYRLSERIISNITTSFSTGAGVRMIKGNNSGYSYTENLSGKTLLSCINDAAAIAGTGQTGITGHGFSGKNNLYISGSSIDDATAKKIDLLKRAEAKAFAISPLVEKVEVSLVESQKQVLVINSSGIEAYDIQPMLRFGISVILEKNNARESGSQGGGGRFNLSYFDTRTPEIFAEEAVNQALVLLDARPAPAGEMEVILGPGESGILLHESIGHPLEADSNYRGSSAFSGRIGETVASKLCTIIDQGNLPHLRGSINVDDEGNDSGKTILIENGILKTYMFDMLTARHYKTQSHNGRRESFRDMPIPRMTTTYMLAGQHEPGEIIKSVKKGIYAKSFSGGQVDTSSGDFVFSITEGYMIENGSLSYPIKCATLIGNGPEILKRVVMVGNDLVMSDGKWTCGKEGQHVPVSVGIPTVKLSHITVGGTQND